MKSSRAKTILLHAGILAIFTTPAARAGAETLARFHCQPGAAAQDMCEEAATESPLSYTTNRDSYIAVALLLPDLRLVNSGYDRFMFGFEWQIEQGTKIRMALYRKVSGVLQSPPIYSEAFSVYPEECQLGICELRGAWGTRSELIGWLTDAGNEEREYAAEVVVTTMHEPSLLNDPYSKQESFRVTANFTDADACAIVAPRPLGTRNLLVLLPLLIILGLRWNRAGRFAAWSGALSLCTFASQVGAAGLPMFYEDAPARPDHPVHGRPGTPGVPPPLTGGFELPEGGIAARGHLDPQTGVCTYDGVTFTVDPTINVPGVRLVQNDPEETGRCELRVSYQPPSGQSEDANVATRRPGVEPISRQQFDEIKHSAELLDRFLLSQGRSEDRPRKSEGPVGSGAAAGDCVIRAMGRLSQYNALGPNVGIPGFEPLIRFPMLDDLYVTTTVVDSGNGFAARDLIGPDAFPYGLGLLGYETLPHQENAISNHVTPTLWQTQATQWFRLGPNIVAGAYFDPAVGYHHKYQVSVIHQPRGRVSITYFWQGTLPTRYPILPEVYARFRWTYFNCPASWMETNTAPQLF